ncbi:MAG: DUF2059 domain-containing protein, partial [Pseudomonadota bacterium]
MFSLRVLLSLVVVSLFTTAFAADTKREKATELMDVMNMESTMDAMYSQMEAMLQGMAKELDIQPSEQEIFNRYNLQIVDLMREALSWEELKAATIDIYEVSFSEEEIDAMLVFYRTEAGQSILKKMPAVMQESR